MESYQCKYMYTEIINVCGMMNIYNYLKNGLANPEMSGFKVSISHKTLSLTVVRSSCSKQPTKMGQV